VLEKGRIKIAPSNMGDDIVKMHWIANVAKRIDISREMRSSGGSWGEFPSRNGSNSQGTSIDDATNHASRSITRRKYFFKEPERDKYPRRHSTIEPGV
jgi:hypothetical protein